jgi:biotin carboxylase
LVRFVEDAANLASAFAAVLAERANSRGQARMPIVLLEEFMPGEEVSVETFTVSGRTKVIGITDKTVSGIPAFIETMHMFPAQLTASREREAVQAAWATLAAIGYEGGLAHTEVKLTPAGARVVEVNARMAGNHIYRLIELTTGLNLFELSIRLALGEVSVEHELPAPRGSAAVAYLLPPGSGRIDAVEGLETLREDAGTAAQVCEVEIRRGAGDDVTLAGDNDDYIGHFIVHDARPNEARRVAEKLLGRVRVQMSQEAQ